ncbi:hypothetical protein M3D00_00555 [Dietzia cinnamea]|nr:hypothetical protein [Dietzia cinnamea]
MILTEAFPAHLDINRLVLFDHGVLHSADLDGPESLHPPTPIRVGELGMKRQRLEEGLRVLIRAGLAEMFTESSGIEFGASDSAESFLRILESDYSRVLHERAQWVVENFGNIDDNRLREQMREISSHWPEEFEAITLQYGSEF